MSHNNITNSSAIAGLLVIYLSAEDFTRLSIIFELFFVAKYHKPRSVAF